MENDYVCKYCGAHFGSDKGWFDAHMKTHNLSAGGKQNTLLADEVYENAKRMSKYFGM